MGVSVIHEEGLKWIFTTFDKIPPLGGWVGHTWGGVKRDSHNLWQNSTPGGWVGHTWGGLKMDSYNLCQNSTPGWVGWSYMERAIKGLLQPLTKFHPWVGGLVIHGEGLKWILTTFDKIPPLGDWAGHTWGGLKRDSNNLWQNSTPGWVGWSYMGRGEGFKRILTTFDKILPLGGWAGHTWGGLKRDSHNLWQNSTPGWVGHILEGLKVYLWFSLYPFPPFCKSVIPRGRPLKNIAVHICEQKQGKECLF